MKPKRDIRNLNKKRVMKKIKARKQEKALSWLEYSIE